MAISVPTLTVSKNEANRRVVLLVGSDIGTTVTVYRKAGLNSPVPVRGGFEVSMTTAEKICLDYEVPQGYSLDYYVVATDGVDTETSTTQSVSAFDFGGDVVFSLGDPKNGMNINVESLQTLKYGISQDVVRVWGRQDPVVISGVREMPSGSLNLITLTLDERAELLNILQSGSIIGFNPWKDTYGVDSISYFSVADVSETRPSPFAEEAARRWSLAVQQVAAPAAVWEYPTGDAQTWETFRDGAPLWDDVDQDLWLDAVGL